MPIGRLLHTVQIGTHRNADVFTRQQSDTARYKPTLIYGDRLPPPPRREASLREMIRANWGRASKQDKTIKWIRLQRGGHVTGTLDRARISAPGPTTRPPAPFHLGRTF